MRMRRYVVLVLAAVAPGCSLLVHFDQQPCDQAAECLPGFICSDAGLCVDAGVSQPLPDGGSTCSAVRELCSDGLDNDCDGQADCLDPDCGGVSCDDRDPCTTGETCSGNACRGGTVMVCNAPPNTSCQMANGTCDRLSGRCTYPSLVDGTSCGTGASSRCCAGACVNTATNAANCGGCGIVCAQTCESIDSSSCAVREPANTSGRCGCGADAGCPNGQACALNGRCAPTSAATQCAPGQTLGDAGVCSNYCRY